MRRILITILLLSLTLSSVCSSVAFAHETEHMMHGNMHVTLDLASDQGIDCCDDHPSEEAVQVLKISPQETKKQGLIKNFLSEGLNFEVANKYRDTKPILIDIPALSTSSFILGTVLQRK